MPQWTREMPVFSLLVFIGSSPTAEHGIIRSASSVSHRPVESGRVRGKIRSVPTRHRFTKSLQTGWAGGRCGRLRDISRSVDSRRSPREAKFPRL